MKKLLLALSILTLFTVPLLAVAPVTNAVDVVTGACNNPDAVTTPDFCKDKQTANSTNPLFGPGGILTVAARILSLVIGISAVIIIIISGLRLILAGGDSGAASNARRSIIYSCAALVVALTAQAIVVLILSKL